MNKATADILLAAQINTWNKAMRAWMAEHADVLEILSITTIETVVVRTRTSSPYSPLDLAWDEKIHRSFDLEAVHDVLAKTAGHTKLHRVMKIALKDPTLYFGFPENANHFVTSVQDFRSLNVQLEQKGSLLRFYAAVPNMSWRERLYTLGTLKKQT